MGGLSTPMWVVELDGQVNLYRIFFSVNFTKDPWVAGSAMFEIATVIEGYDFVVVDHLNNVVKAGEVKLDPIYRTSYVGNQKHNTGRAVSGFWPLGVNLADEVVQSFVGVDPLSDSPASSTATVPNRHGGYATITHQKLIR